MRTGDLTSTTPADVLRAFAGDGSTACLHVVDAALVPGNRPQPGARLVSSGELAPGALAAMQALAELAETAQPDRQLQAAAFAELTASAALQVLGPGPAASTAPIPTSTPPREDEPLPLCTRQDTDTASLLRELSSLGLDDEPGPPPPIRPARPPAPRPAPPVRRRGLFGR